MSNSQSGAHGVACEDFGLVVERVDAPPEIVFDSEVSSSQRMQRLASTIETAVIPRLLVSHGANAPITIEPMSSIDVLGPASVARFVKLLMSQDSLHGAAFVEGLIARGVPMKSILLDLMAPAARRFGEMWTADLCDFVDVTLGLSRMQQILRRMTGEVSIVPYNAAAGHRALLVPAPGEQHTFGLRIVEEFLLREGWEVRSNLTAGAAEIVAMIEADDYDLVGFSMSGETLLNALVSAIKDLRRVSENRTIFVMVGGVIFAEHPELVAQVGADVMAIDADDAVRKANAWARSVRV